MNTTGASNVTIQVGGRWVALVLTEEDVRRLHHALYIAYGNDHEGADLFNKLRRAVGERWWAEVVAPKDGR